MGKLQEVVQLDLLYSAWATRALLQAAAQLPVADRNRDLSVSHGSILGTIFHFHVSERFWAKCLAAQQIPPLHEIAAEPVPAEIRLEELASECEKVSRVFEDWFKSTTEEELANPLSCRISATVDFPYVRWQLIRHVVNHSSLHRGQIVGMIRALGTKPPNLDVMTYLLQHANLT
jgi:uncharacterized damage-inducible protein DinB